jgi:tetratricopeptide (TPR) repeat protein
VASMRLLRSTYSMRALAFDRLLQPDEAIRNWNQAIDLSPLAEQPSFRAARASLRLRTGMVAEAVAEVVEMTMNPNSTADQWFDFACFYAKASDKVANKKQEYADRAMELLQKAVKAGYDTVDYMRKDKDLVPLRGREDFKKLIAEMMTTKMPEKRP